MPVSVCSTQVTSFNTQWSYLCSIVAGRVMPTSTSTHMQAASPSLSYGCLFLQVMLGYFAVSALAGLAVTYYYDSPQNHKLMTILKVGLQLLALLLIVTSTNIAEASVAIAVLAIAWKGVSSAEFAAWAGKGTWGDMLSRYRPSFDSPANFSPALIIRVCNMLKFDCCAFAGVWYCMTGACLWDWLCNKSVFGMSA